MFVPRKIFVAFIIGLHLLSVGRLSCCAHYHESEATSFRFDANNQVLTHKHKHGAVPHSHDSCEEVGEEHGDGCCRDSQEHDCTAEFTTTELFRTSNDEFCEKLQIVPLSIFMDRENLFGERPLCVQEDSGFCGRGSPVRLHLLFRSLLI